MSESNITKKAIACALKELLTEKSFDKITINDITARCGLNRQTFYYHFEDRYDLMNWIYYNEVFLPLVEDLNEENYGLSFKKFFQKMSSEKVVYQNVLSDTSEYGFKEYLFSILEELISSLLNEKKATMKVRFYTYGLLGIIVDWIKTGMKITPEQLANQLESIILEIKKMS